MNLTSSCALAIPLALAAFAQTPAPQRTILENRVTQGKDKPAEQPAPARSLDSLLNSTEDLNSIRDGYLRRVAGDGCRPDVAIRVAELRSRLGENGRPNGQAPIAAASSQTSADLESSLLLLAAGWYQSRPDHAPPRANREADRNQLLDFVLSPKDPEAGAAQSAADAAQVKAELDRLLATCRAGH